MNKNIEQANGLLFSLQPIFTLSNLLALIGASLILWGMVNSMETRITQNEDLLQEVRGEVKALTDVNRRLAALEEEALVNRARLTDDRNIIQDYLGTRSIIEFRIKSLERELRDLKTDMEKSATDEQ